jgi:DNA-binding response OmpR family regulator
MRVLVVDDSPEMQKLLSRIVESLGAEVQCAASAREARAALQAAPPSLLLLDLGLPDEDGFRLVEDLQQNTELRDVPVVFITGRAEVASKVAAFSLGAEDYIVKPFDALEVKARLEAKLKKLERKHELESVLVRGGLVIDLRKQRVQAGPEHKTVKLTPKEFLLLVQLARHPDVVLSRSALLDAVWGTGADVIDRTVDTHVSSLRRKLGAFGRHIEAVPGQGYRFVAETAAKAA